MLQSPDKMNSAPHRPATFDPQDPSVKFDVPSTADELADDALPLPPAQIAGSALPASAKRGFGWGKLLFGAICILVSLAVGLAVTNLIDDLFSRADWLGWAALGVAGLAVLAATMLVAREIAGIMRLSRITRLREEAERAHRQRDDKQAHSVAQHVMSLYSSRQDLAWGLKRVRDHRNDIFDADDLLKHLERELLRALDREAALEVARAARRVSVVTAVSPNALIDMAMVLISNMRMLRRLATLYGGRPGTLGLLKLMRMVVAHLTVTGGMAVGDSIIQQFVGHGVAARVSARLGEGVINGLFTARIGLAAIDVVRPLPYLALQAPALKDVMGGVMKSSK